MRGRRLDYSQWHGAREPLDVPEEEVLGSQQGTLYQATYAEADEGQATVHTQVHDVQPRVLRNSKDREQRGSAVEKSYGTPGLAGPFPDLSHMKPRITAIELSPSVRFRGATGFDLVREESTFCSFQESKRCIIGKS
ncbi:hypothetical protein EAH_00025860 [Eimeria acervulina]|uniref:Uncharacterized protein n=1 Tax=Eimeria acervulina TaxID=5801 RepID=U6GBY1_EIMAC|nr:hypothetical protein EAH_00025860 [Eimeria acervulina]CDI77640.1 hypothetical protein EAH_00025860 [Eimeria acervulina]